jgi:hypothetical protein
VLAALVVSAVLLAPSLGWLLLLFQRAVSAEDHGGSHAGESTSGNRRSTR